MTKSDNINELISALVKAQADFKTAKKDSKNPFFKSNYADFESVVTATRDSLLKNSLCVIQTTSYVGDLAVLHTTLFHSSGQFITGEYPISAPIMDAQKMGSAMTYAKRYAYSAIVGAVTSDDDDGEKAQDRGIKYKQEVKQESKPPATAQQAIESLRKTVSEKPKEDYSGYVISFGKYKGKSLSTLSEAAILQYRDFLIKSAEKDNKPMSNNALDFVNHAESYLMTLGYSFDKPPQDSQLITEKDLEEIPF
jgi:hypothetical protein